MKYKIIMACSLVSGCGLQMVSDANQMPPAQLAQQSDAYICELSSIYNQAIGAPTPSPAFVAEFQRRGLICDFRDGVKIAYTQSRMDADDDAKCQQYGAKPGSDSYINCRAQFQAQRENAITSQEANPAQREAIKSSTYPNSANIGLR